MVMSPDGILEAVFDPLTASVRLSVDGGMWPSPVDALTITRSAPAAPTVPVRGLEDRPAAGGYLLWTDHEAGLDAPVTYTVTGTVYGIVVASATVTVVTAGAAWGVWLKAPGRPELTCLVVLAEIDDVEVSTRGGIYQIHGGDAVGQDSGTDTETVTITVATETPAETSRLMTLLATRTVLVQTGEPQEIASTYYQILKHSRANPTQLRADLQAYRLTRIALQRVSNPAGQGTAATGTTYTSVLAGNATYQDLLDDHASYWDVLRGV